MNDANTFQMVLTMWTKMDRDERCSSQSIRCESINKACMGATDMESRSVLEIIKCSKPIMFLF